MQEFNVLSKTLQHHKRFIIEKSFPFTILNNSHATAGNAAMMMGVKVERQRRGGT